MPKQIPKHPYIPIVGQTLSLHLDPNKWLQESYDKYGSLSEFKLLMHGQSYLCQDKEIFNSALMDHNEKISSKLGYQNSLGLFYKNGLLLTDGAEHRMQRKIFQPAFQTKYLTHYCEASNQIFHHHFSNYLKTGEMAVYSEFRKMIFAHAMAMFLGIEDTELSHKLSNAYDCLMTKGISNIFRINFPGSSFSEAKKADQLIMNELNIWMRSQKHNKQNDLFNEILLSLSNYEEEAFNQMIVNGFKFLLLAFHDTLSSTLSCACLHLSKDMDMQKQLTEFVSKNYSTALFLKNSKEPDMLDCFFQEIIRLYPPTPLISRFITQDFELKGWQFKKGKYLIFTPLFLHRDPRKWVKPNEFILDRFIDPTHFEAIKSAYTPFGIGEHTCMGKHLARLIFRVIISNFLYHSQIKNISNENKVNFLPIPIPHNFTLKIKKRG